MTTTEFLISDNQLKIICLISGSVTLLLNLLCLHLIKKLHRNVVPNIYFITLLLQGLYLAQNVLFNFMLVPFIYAEYGGGYCIGIVCDAFVLPFWVYFAVYTFLTCSISGCSILLIFFRFQNLQFSGSKFKLSHSNAKIASVVFMVGINFVPIRYTIENLLMNAEELSSLLHELCADCDWIKTGRNFGVIDPQSARVNAIIVVATVFVCFTFGVVCAWEIMKIMLRHRKNSVIRGSKFTMTIMQTRQSFVQIFFFTIFLTIPILMFLSIPLLGVTDEILIPTILLLSLSSFEHSFVLIASTQAFHNHMRKMLCKRVNKHVGEQRITHSPRSTIVQSGFIGN